MNFTHCRDSKVFLRFHVKHKDVEKVQKNIFITREMIAQIKEGFSDSESFFVVDLIDKKGEKWKSQQNENEDIWVVEM